MKKSYPALNIASGAEPIVSRNPFSSCLVFRFSILIALKLPIPVLSFAINPYWLSLAFKAATTSPSSAFKSSAVIEKSISGDSNEISPELESPAGVGCGPTGGVFSVGPFCFPSTVNPNSLMYCSSSILEISAPVCNDSNVTSLPSSSKYLDIIYI